MPGFIWKLHFKKSLGNKLRQIIAHYNTSILKLLWCIVLLQLWRRTIL